MHLHIKFSQCDDLTDTTLTFFQKNHNRHHIPEQIILRKRHNKIQHAARMQIPSMSNG